VVVNGWKLHYFRPFAAALDELEVQVTELSRRDPTGYKSHPKTRLLASLYKAIMQTVPARPDHPDFRLGKALGSEYANWRRVKKGVPDRYRLFFRFASRPAKTIVYVCFNDEDTLRKAGSKTDVYTAFRRMLARGEVPGGIEALLKESGDQIP
jgi:toxin YhaV